jgi:hypothetical protein
MQNPEPTSLYQEFRARCRNCTFELKFNEAMSAGYRVGDSMYMDPTDDTKGRCGRCKTYTMVIIKVPEPPTPVQPDGFWKIPET